MSLAAGKWDLIHLRYSRYQARRDIIRAPYNSAALRYPSPENIFFFFYLGYFRCSK